ncbi:MAG: hypothetical protein WA948_09310 [Pontixanthobacter sp.]
MTDAIIISSASIIGLTILVLALLKGWQDWIALKSREYDTAQRTADGSPYGAARIEIADLKERIRHLEAIASGVDL